MALGVMTYIRSLTKTGSGIQVILRLLPTQSERLQYSYYWWKGFVRYAVEMISGVMTYIRSLMKIGSGIQVVLRLVPTQSERLQCWYYWWKGFVRYAVEMTSGVMTYIRSLMKTGSGIQVILRLLPTQSERLQCWYYWWKGFVRYAVEMASSCSTYQVSRRSVQEFKLYCGCGLNHFRGCSAVITDGRHLWRTPSICPQLIWYSGTGENAQLFYFNCHMPYIFRKLKKWPIRKSEPSQSQWKRRHS
jgi:hypothetical protein